MAIIKISGTVDKIFQDGRCVKVTESHEKDGKTYTDRFTAWFEQSPGLTEGDRVNISGFFSVKQGKPWTDRDNNERTSIDVNVNRARVDTGSDGTTAPSARQEPQDAEPWAQAPTDGYDGGTPF
jgi:hypothetical protein